MFQQVEHLITCSSCLKQEYIEIIHSSLPQQIEWFVCVSQQLLLACPMSEEVSLEWRSLGPRHF